MLLNLEFLSLRLTTFDHFHFPSSSYDPNASEQSTLYAPAHFNQFLPILSTDFLGGGLVRVSRRSLAPLSTIQFSMDVLAWPPQAGGPLPFFRFMHIIRTRQAGTKAKACFYSPRSLYDAGSSCCSHHYGLLSFGEYLFCGRKIKYFIYANISRCMGYNVSKISSAANFANAISFLNHFCEPKLADFHANNIFILFNSELMRRVREKCLNS